jgi:lipopolysaccharide transport system ATP-binding protein
MQMRLAFAVAAHLEPDILLVDEVLAVGDVAFQQKCLGKMDEVSRHGRTILFVSHQMNQLRRLCTRCVWLDHGRVVEIGPTADVINRYESAMMAPAQPTLSGASSNAAAVFTGWEIVEPEDSGHLLSTMGPCTVRFWLDVRVPVRVGHHGIGLYDADGRLVWGTGADNLELAPGRHALDYAFEALPVRPGAYGWHVTLFDDQRLLDSCAAVPELSVGTLPTGHRRDECAGFFNLSYVFGHHRTEPVSSAEPVLSPR